MMIDRQQIRSRQTTVAFFLVILIIIVSVIRWINVSIIIGSNLQLKFHLQESPRVYPTEVDCSLNCSEISFSTEHIVNSRPRHCPEYFKWIHEDLRPWTVTGITRKMVEKAKDVAHIRIVIVKGRVYTEKYREVFQTRDAITIWGILQLIRLYPGRIPDVDLVFECGDKPVIRKQDYSTPNGLIPPVFHYCGDDMNYDIAFPDWSFWGWPEVNIKPWEILKEELKEGNNIIKWSEREPYAYWKGNTKLGITRRDLVKCNTSDGEDWKARIFEMEWSKEKTQGFKNSDLASQCTYRYKIYTEGVAWSVSEKYILACDSLSLIVNPHYYDFFTRSLLPTVHYWPIDDKDQCKSIKLAVEWGNKYTDKAQEIGKAGSSLVQEHLRMEYIYDYMYHLLHEYAKLMKYKPTVPKEAVEICSEALLCSVRGAKRRFRKHSMVKNPADSLPCVLPEDDPAAIRAFLERKNNLTNEALRWVEN